VRAPITPPPQITTRKGFSADELRNRRPVLTVARVIFQEDKS
jgi:hypothetical protein